MRTAASLGEIRGLPAHILLVHAVVILVPMAAVLLILAAWWPAARIRLGPFLPLLAAGCLVLVPVTTNAGEWLRARVGNTNPLVARHAELGDQLLPWTAALLLLTVGVWLIGRRRDTAAPAAALSTGGEGDAAVSGRAAARDAGYVTGRPLLLSIGVAVVATAVAVGTIVQVVRIGESGSKAVWSGVVTSG